MWGALFAWMSAFRIAASVDVVTNRKPITGSKSITTNDITFVDMRRLTLGSRIRSSEYQSVVLSCRNPSRATITINARMFPPNRLKEFVDLLDRRGITVKRG